VLDPDQEILQRLAFQVSLPETAHLLTQEEPVVEPAPQRSLKRVWIMALVLIIVIWVIYALAGGPSTPSSETTDSLVEPAR
jgi:hypothetical protein